MRRPLLVLWIASLPLAAEPTTEIFADGFERPVWAGSPPEDSEHIWIVEQAGKIWKLDAKTGARAAQPFLDISNRVSRAGNEEGLLGLAFPTDFATTGRFYINYSTHDQSNRIERHHADAPDFNSADDSKHQVLLEYSQPYKNHNGGWLAFGPDGHLYIGTGDGGNANDPKNNGQNPDSLLGKLLRIDVSPEKAYRCPADNPFVGKDGRDEIWVCGLRNPWRCSFDRQTGDLWIGDVGQNKWEEIDFLPAGDGAGANFGWRLREGDHATPEVGGDKPENAIDPVYDYDHGVEPRQGLSVTGGCVYRGPIAELRGRYIFGDYQNRRIWSFVLKNGKASDFKDHTDVFTPDGGQIGLITSFGEAPNGDLYLTCLEGSVLKVVDR